MGDFYIKGKQVCGTTNNASAVTCLDKDGNQSTVQDEITEVNKNLSNVRVYVGEDKKLHFVDSEGADSALPFNSGIDNVLECCVASGGSQSATMGVGGVGTSNSNSTFTGTYIKFEYPSGSYYKVTALKPIKALRYLWYPSSGLAYNDVKEYATGDIIINSTSTYICVMNVSVLEAL